MDDCRVLSMDGNSGKPNSTVICPGVILTLNAVEGDKVRIGIEGPDGLEIHKVPAANSVRAAESATV